MGRHIRIHVLETVDMVKEAVGTYWSSTKGMLLSATGNCEISLKSHTLKRNSE